MVVKGSPHGQVSEERGGRKEIRSSKQRIDKGGNDRPASPIRLRLDRELQNNPLRLREVDRDIHRGMIIQIACVVSNRARLRVHEVDVEAVAVVQVVDEILPGAPEDATAVDERRRSPAVLT